MFFVFGKKNDNEQLMITSCCHVTMHAECIMLLRSVLSRLSFDVVLECGQATFGLMCEHYKTSMTNLLILRKYFV